MPRFKQPLSGLSRLSDRVGGGDGALRLVYQLQGASGTISVGIDGSVVDVDDLVLVFAVSSSTLTPSIPGGFGYVDLGTIGTSSGIVRAAYRPAFAGETATGSFANSQYVSVMAFRNHNGIGQLLTTSLASSTSSPNIGTLSGATKGSRIAVGTNSNFSAARVPGEAAVFGSTGKIGISVNPMESAGSFGGAQFTTASAPAQQNFFGVEVLAA
jgi:hypothetical protein